MRVLISCHISGSHFAATLKQVFGVLNGWMAAFTNSITYLPLACWHVRSWRNLDAAASRWKISPHPPQTLLQLFLHSLVVSVCPHRSLSLFMLATSACFCLAHTLLRNDHPRLGVGQSQIHPVHLCSAISFCVSLLVSSHNSHTPICRVLLIWLLISSTLAQVLLDLIGSTKLLIPLLPRNLLDVTCLQIFSLIGHLCKLLA